MSGRYLYSYNSKIFTGTDRDAINQFNTNFDLQNTADPSRFSDPFYMVCIMERTVYTTRLYYGKWKSFSAATVFTSAFESLPNAKIVGETTDGSSGNSRRFYLKNSIIGVKVSTMLSFQ